MDDSQVQKRHRRERKQVAEVHRFRELLSRHRLDFGEARANLLVIPGGNVRAGFDLRWNWLRLSWLELSAGYAFQKIHACPRDVPAQFDGCPRLWIGAVIVFLVRDRRQNPARGLPLCPDLVRVHRLKKLRLFRLHGLVVSFQCDDAQLAWAVPTESAKRRMS